MSRPPIVAFDIETIPDTALGRRLQGHGGGFLEVAEAMLAKRLEETEGRSDFLKTPWHRIVTISVAWLDLDRGQFKLGSLGDDDLDEGAVLEGFFAILRRAQPPLLVSWNGNGFDLPVIRYRAMLHGIDAGTYYEAGDRFNNYQGRFHELHTDLMDVLSGYGAADRVGLDELCRILGLPGKTVTEGHRVYRHIARGEWDVVKTYCELDALNTLMLWLAWESSRGRLTGGELGTVCGRIADALDADGRGPLVEYAEALRQWKPGDERRALAAELEAGDS